MFKSINPQKQYFLDQATCAHCTEILIDAYQTEDGLHICKKCYDKIFSLGGNICNLCFLNIRNCFPDNAYRNYINEIVIKCPLECKWVGSFHEYHTRHILTCSNKKIKCQYCKNKFNLSEYETHQQSCGYRPVECEFCKKQIQYNQLKDHFNIVNCPEFPEACPQCKTIFPYYLIDDHKKICEFQPCICGTYISDGKDILGKEHLTSENIIKHGKLMLSKFTKCKQDFESLVQSVETKQNEDSQSILQFVQGTPTISNDILSKFEKELEYLKRLYESHEASILRIIQEQNKITDYNIIDNGHLVWTIYNIQEKMKSSETKIIYRILYTSPHGYKFIVKIYLNGSYFRSSHVAVFVELTPGPYDEILVWPFEGVIEFAFHGKTHNVYEKIRINNPQMPMLRNCLQPNRKEPNPGMGIRNFVSFEIFKKDIINTVSNCATLECKIRPRHIPHFAIKN